MKYGDRVKCLRRVFDTLEAAVIAKAKRRNTRVFACPICRRYHLTTKGQKP